MTKTNAIDDGKCGLDDVPGRRRLVPGAPPVRSPEKPEMTTATTPVERRLHDIINASNRKAAHAYLREAGIHDEPQTLLSKLDPMVALAKHLGNRAWQAARREDIIACITEHRFRKGAHKAGTPVVKDKALSLSTQYLWCVHLRTFYKWLLDLDKEEVPPQFKRMPFRKKDAIKKHLTTMALSPEEVRQILAGAKSPRDQCIVTLLIEGGFRASEAAALRLDRIERRDGGYWLTLPDDEPLLKTGPRAVAIPIIAFRHEFEAWLNEHPRRHEPAAPLFVSLSNRTHGKRMKGPTIGDVIVRSAKRAGMRHVHAHMLRHTSATLKLAKGMPSEAVRLTHGWTPQSTMLGYYSHVAPHYEAMMMEAHGMASKKPRLLDIVGSTACQVCGSANPIKAATCKKCGCRLSEGAQESERRARLSNALDYVVPQAVQGLSDMLLLAVARARGFEEVPA